MENKIRVGVIGATGMVGQKYIQLLAHHPWFEVAYVAASPKSAGKKYTEAVAGRWQMNTEIPRKVGSLIVGDALDIKASLGRCQFVFSAVEMEKKAVRKLEDSYAKVGIPVFSNNSAHRSTPDVPMIIPEINSGHMDMIRIQRNNRKWGKGFIVVKPNCSIQSYLTPVFALIKAGFNVSDINVTTMQAVSGAGYPGVSSLDLIDNVIPFINGEEEKTEKEPLKILGCIGDDELIHNSSINISAHCNRVPVIDGHMACVSLKFDESTILSLDQIADIWRSFSSVPQNLNLPSAPKPAIIYHQEDNRPQPRKDRDAGNGMAVSVGRLRMCNVLDIRFVGLSHNTVRGAAGGGILNAELLKAMGYL